MNVKLVDVVQTVAPKVPAILELIETENHHVKKCPIRNDPAAMTTAQLTAAGRHSSSFQKHSDGNRRRDLTLQTELRGPNLSF